jgi:hypothetical protein
MPAKSSNRRLILLCHKLTQATIRGISWNKWAVYRNALQVWRMLWMEYQIIYERESDAKWDSAEWFFWQAWRKKIEEELEVLGNFVLKMEEG